MVGILGLRLGQGFSRKSKFLHVQFNFTVLIQQRSARQTVRNQGMPNVSRIELEIAVQNIDDVSNDKRNFYLENL